MTESLIRLALCRLIAILYVKKLSVLDGVLRLDLIDPLAGFEGDYLASCGFVLFRWAGF